VSALAVDVAGLERSLHGDSLKAVKNGARRDRSAISAKEIKITD
jgi:hypothetical protein